MSVIGASSGERFDRVISAQALLDTSSTRETAATTPKKMNDGRFNVASGSGAPTPGTRLAGAPATGSRSVPVASEVSVGSVIDSLRFPTTARQIRLAPAHSLPVESRTYRRS